MSPRCCCSHPNLKPRDNVLEMRGGCKRNASWPVSALRVDTKMPSWVDHMLESAGQLTGKGGRGRQARYRRVDEGDYAIAG